MPAAVPRPSPGAARRAARRVRRLRFPAARGPAAGRGHGAGRGGGAGRGHGAGCGHGAGRGGAAAVRGHGVECGGAECGQGAVGADLDEDPHALGGQGPHRVGEPDRLPGLPRPVAGVALAGRLPGQRLDPQDPRRVVLQAGRGLAELGQDRVHPGGVERVGDPQRPGPPAPRPRMPRDPGDRGGVAGDHCRRRAVDGRERYPGRAGQRGGDLGLGGLDGGHRAAAGQRLHQPGPRRDQAARVRQRQHPRRVRRGDLPDRVARDRVRDHPARGQQRDQPGLDREQARLRVQRLVRPVVPGVSPGPAEDHPGDRDAEAGLEQAARLVERGGEDRARGVQLRAHPGPLGALPGEQEPDPRPAGRGRRARHRRGGRLPGRHRAQPGQQLFPACPQHDRPVLERQPGRGQRPRHVARAQVRPRRRPARQPPRLRRQGTAGPAGDQPRRHARRERRHPPPGGCPGAVRRGGQGTSGTPRAGGRAVAGRPGHRRPRRGRVPAR